MKSMVLNEYFRKPWEELTELRKNGWLKILLELGGGPTLNQHSILTYLRILQNPKKKKSCFWYNFQVIFFSNFIEGFLTIYYNYEAKIWKMVQICSETVIAKT